MPAARKKTIWTIVWKIAALMMLLLVTMGTCLHCFPSHFFDREYPYYREHKEFARSHEGDCRVLILGDSVAKCAWYPELLTPDSHNYSLGGGTTIDQYYYLLEYLEYHEAPQVVFYTQYPVHLDYAEGLFPRNVYFHRLRLSDLWDMLNRLRAFPDRSVLGDINPYWEALLDCTYSPAKYMTAFLSGIFDFSREKVNRERYESAKAHLGWARLGSPGKGDLVNSISLSSCKVDAIIDYYLRLILSLCEEHGIQFVYQGVPFNEATYRALQEGFYTDYIGYLQALQADYPAARIDSEIYYYDNFYFDDEAHFNPQGAWRYTTEMREKYAEFFPADAA